MPLTPPGAAGVIAANLASTAMIGMLIPQMAAGVAAGLCYWSPLISVVTADTGTLGAGVGGPLPVLVPPTLIPALISAFPSSGLIGMLTAPLATGLANGIVQAFLQGMLTTVHPTVGTGAAVAKFVAPPAYPMMSLGLKSAGMIGISSEQLAIALGMALDITFASLVMPVPIVGPSSPLPGAGVGTGKII